MMEPYNKNNEGDGNGVEAKKGGDVTGWAVRSIRLKADTSYLPRASLLLTRSNSSRS
jgi:hypothetical protein